MAVSSASSAPEPVSRRLVTAGTNLTVDAVTAEVVGALRNAGISSLLLKGPAIARWLYEGPGVRLYGDTDLMVPPESRQQAEAVLTGLGFTAPTPQMVGDRPLHAELWERERDLAKVDLHRTLVLLEDTDPEELWRVMSERPDRMTVADHEVHVPAPAPRLFHIALHALNHLTDAPQPLQDLERAVDQRPREEWIGAAGVADRLGVIELFTDALTLVAGGRELAGDLGLEPEPGAAARLMTSLASQQEVSAAKFIAWMGSLNFRQRLYLIARKLFPPPSYLRSWSPMARKGPVGLVLAYLWRPFVLARLAVQGLRGLRASRSTESDRE